MSNRSDAYLRKLRTYAAPDYWRRVVALHGLRGLGSEMARILAPPDRTERRAPRPDHVDFSDLTSNPGKAIRLALESGNSITPMLEVPMSSLRKTHLGISIDDTVSNPFTRSVVDYLSGKHTVYDGSALERFYQSWRPETLARFVGVVADERAPLSRPVIVGDLPWDPYRNVDQLLRHRDVYELDRLAKFGRARNGRHGYDYFGPTSPALGEYRFKKHCRVARSIVDEGFDPTVHIIDAQLLAGEPSWALIVRDGKHRTTALAAIGAQRVVVSLPSTYPVIRRQDAPTWPGVVAGLYTIGQALEVFDRFVAGRPPSSFPTSTARADVPQADHSV